MVSQVKCERCFETYVVIFTYTFSGVPVNATVLTLLLRSFAGKKNVLVAEF